MEDKFIQSGEIEKYISIGKTKITEIIKNGKFVKPIIIDGFSYPPDFVDGSPKVF